MDGNSVSITAFQKKKLRQVDVLDYDEDRINRK